ncbi:MAG: hypothetical protein MJY45_04075 [Bacteroidales bacterium]|nr:hypothetical protein [Bacteroidales bacterium]
MLNRRILRIKAFKVLYSYAENPSLTLKDMLSQFEMACEATRNLYLYMLSLVCALTDEARGRIEAAAAKFNPTEEELHPNMKFVDNSMAVILGEDPDLAKLLKKKKLSWEQNDVFLRKLYETIKGREYFKEYLSSATCSREEDAALFVRIFENELVDNADLESILEDMSIFWLDDLAYALTYCCRTLKSIAGGAAWALPELYLDADHEFVEKLIGSAYRDFHRYCEMVAESVDKWEKDRLFVVDLVLIVCGLAEAEHIDGIPARVTVNEYVEISKYYSTPKSRSFVNGLLDRLIKDKLSLSLSDDR